MSDPKELVQACEQRIMSAARDISQVLGIDIAEYPDRELQRRFMAAPERAEAITDKDLKLLRAAAEEMSLQLAVDVQKALAGERVWLSLADGDEEILGGKELSLITPVWDAVRLVDSRFEKLASRYRLPDDRDPPGYVAPRRFVRRLYLPTLVETCLRDLANLRNLRQAANAQTMAEKRQNLSVRWAAAAPESSEE
jgi:hypothetical protein